MLYCHKIEPTVDTNVVDTHCFSLSLSFVVKSEHVSHCISNVVAAPILLSSMGTTCDDVCHSIRNEHDDIGFVVGRGRMGKFVCMCVDWEGG